MREDAMQNGWRVAVAILASLAAYPLAPIAVALAKREDDAVTTIHGGARALIEAWRLPRWARWLETQDDRDGLLPGGLYEETIWDVYRAKGWAAAARAWLWRNRAYRLARALGPAIPKPEAPLTALESAQRWAILLSGQPLALPSLDGLHLIVMQMSGKADPEKGIDGEWEGRISVTTLDGTGPPVDVWCRRRVWHAKDGYVRWRQSGWKLDPYFDAVRDWPLVDWPTPNSAAGMIAIPWLRFERASP